MGRQKPIILRRKATSRIVFRFGLIYSEKALSKIKHTALLMYPVRSVLLNFNLKFPQEFIYNRYTCGVSTC